jgi:hypothetical protein
MGGWIVKYGTAGPALQDPGGTAGGRPPEPGAAGRAPDIEGIQQSSSDLYIFFPAPG